MSWMLDVVRPNNVIKQVDINVCKAVWIRRFKWISVYYIEEVTVREHELSRMLYFDSERVATALTINKANYYLAKYLLTKTLEN